MKRLIALLLCALMLTGVSALADKTAIGTLSINGVFTLQCGLPEGYSVTTLTDDGSQVIAALQSEDPLAPVMMLSVAFDETYADVERMNDLSEEELALLETTFTDTDPNVEISYGDTGLGTRLLIARQFINDVQYIEFLSIYKGYFVEFALIPAEAAEDKTLSEEQLQICVDFLTDLDFIPGELPAASPVAGETFTAVIGAYDQAANTIQITLRKPVLLDPETVEALKPGDSLVLNGDTVVVETAVTDEYGAVIVNDDYNLTKDENGMYRPSLYEVPALENGETLTVVIPDNLVYEEQIDLESGELLAEPALKTAADFIAALTADVGPGFDLDNVLVTFDADGNLARVTLEYAPWQ